MNQEVMEAIQEKIRGQPTEDGCRSRRDQKEMTAILMSSQGNRGTTTISIRSELEETTRNWVDDILSSVNQWVWDLREKLRTKDKKNAALFTSSNKDLNENLNLRILETWIDIQAMKILDKTM